jgi:ABC-2 type transport system permease protein
MKAPPPETVDRALGASRGRHAAGGRAPARGFALAALAALYTLTLRQHLHGKRWMVLGALFLAPALLAIVVRATAPNVPGMMLEFSLVFMFIPQALLPLVALLYGSGIIQDELEEQTFTYLQVRPIPKWAIYVVKLLATLTTAVVLTAVFTTLTYVVIYIGAAPLAGPEDLPFRCFKAICIHALAIVAYCCIFGLMSLLTRWMLVLGFLYAAFFEGFLANLPFSIRLLSVIYYARLIAYRCLDFHVTVPRGGTFDLAGEAWQLNVKADPKLLDHPALGTCFQVLVVGSLLCTALAAYLCSRREFYLKTPERG